MAKGINVSETGLKVFNMSKAGFGSAQKTANYLGISKNAVYKWRDNTMPDIENMYMISEYLGVSMNDMIVRN